MTVSFTETQTFRSTPFLRWLVVILVLIEGIVLSVVLVTSAAARNLAGPAFWIAVSVPVLVMGGVLALHLVARIETRVSDQGVSVRMRPFSGRKIAPGEIRDARITDVHPMEYGGWGVRWVSKGRAYIVRGGRGVRLDLRTGVHVLIESRKPEELLESIRQIMREQSD
jgi:hypothetical protein